MYASVVSDPGVRRDEVWFPESGIRRSDVVYHYRRVAEFLLPHVDRRGLCVENVLRKSRVSTARCEDAASLLRLVTDGVAAVHGWTSRLDRPNRPDRLVFDIDPHDDDFRPVADVALGLRDLLQELGLCPWVMTTGSRGLHVIVPIDGRASFDTAKSFAGAVARLLTQRLPDSPIDVGRNAAGRTWVLPYSLRVRSGAPVATPLSWDEVGKRGMHSRRFTLLDILDRLEKTGDPWEGMSRHARSLREPSRRLGRVTESN